MDGVLHRTSICNNNFFQSNGRRVRVSWDFGDFFDELKQISFPHFLVSFWALWCASNPSDKLFSDWIATISTVVRPPNQRTHVESLAVVTPGGAGTILPGHAGWPRAAPQINSPIQNSVDDGLSSVVASSKDVLSASLFIVSRSYFFTKIRILQSIFRMFLHTHEMLGFFVICSCSGCTWNFTEIKLPRRRTGDKRPS